MRVCRGCNNTFQPHAKSQRRCERGCGVTRPRTHSLLPPASKSTYGPEMKFIGVDGEGITHDDGRHDYVLLSVGGESLRASSDGRLSHVDIFPFLYRQFQLNPNAAFVGFYLTYDFSQWFKSLPRERAEMLLTEKGRMARMPKNKENPVPYPVRYDGWEFDILGLRRFKLRPDNDSKAPWLYISDAGSFWQTSFMSAIDPKNWPDAPVATDKQYADIMEGKAKRATAQLDADMVRYNVAENRVLGEAMSRLNRGFLTQDWKLQRSQWFGPGQAASAWLKSIHAPSREQIVEATPRVVLNAAQASYYGGWFEIPRHGLIPGTSYEYDINSAYPHIISQLPCLLHGTWNHTRSPNLGGDLQLVRISTKGKDPYLGGLPHRDKDGIISRPRDTEGWYWLHEIDAAVLANMIHSYTIHETYSYYACDCPSPFESIADLYSQRIAVGKNTAHGKALKIVYNSAYGKFAQSIGNPKYANPIYASLITAGCRTMILDAIATHPGGTRDVLMVATDGVYFRNPHPSLSLSSNTLGLWDEGTKENLCLFMPGVYWDDKARNALLTDTSIPLKSRGINGAKLAEWIYDIDLQFEGGLYNGWPSAEIPVTFSVISPKLALARGKWNTCGTIITDGSKILSSDPTNKRDISTLRTEDGILTTTPYQSRGQNYGYEKRFGMSLEAMIDNDTLITDSGTINLELAELLGQK